MTDGFDPQPIVSAAITYTGRGGYEVIQIADRMVPAPGPEEVRIVVKAAAVNPTDILFRDPAPGVESWPVVPGADAAGVIESVGPGVTRLRVGDQVMTAVKARRPEGGAQARHIVVSAASVVSIPKNATLAEAATLPMNGLTALLALELAGLDEGQCLAVSGGAGLLAHFALALARQKGLKTIADARPEDEGLVRGYGADVVIERSPAFSEAVRRVAPAGVDALLDTAVLGEAAFGAIRDGGVYIPVRGWDDRAADRDIQIKPLFQIKPLLMYDALERTDWLESLRDMVESGKIRLHVAAEYKPEQVAEAQRALSAGGLRGRPVVLF